MPVMNACPTEDQLLRYALGPHSPRSALDPIRRHVSKCARCQGEIAQLTETAGALFSGLSPRPDPEKACLDDLTVAQLTEGTLDPDLRESAVAHLLGCGDCRQRVAEVASLLADDRVQSEVRALDALSVQPKRWNGWRLVAGGLAAAAVLAVLVRSAGTPLPPNVRHREQPVTVTAVPVLALPVGLVDRVDSLVWTGIPRAFQYRVALFREDGVGVWDSVTSDTMMAFPVGIRQEARAVFFWKVEARTDWNRWARSRTGPRRPS